MSLEYKNRGILHKLTSGTKFRPQSSSKVLIKLTAKAVLAAETTVLFAKDLAVNRFVGKETHIKFERRQGKNGKYKTHIKLVRAEAPQQLPRGILHKLDNIGRFFEGDTPFQKKAKIEYKPKTIKGKIAYYGIAKPLAEGTKFHLKTSVKLVKGAALASESAFFAAGSAGINIIARKLRMSSEMSDGGKSAMTALSAVSTGRRAVRYLKIYRKKRVKYKELKRSYKSQKLSSKTAKKKLRSVRKENRPALFKYRIKRIAVYGGNVIRFVKYHAPQSRKSLSLVVAQKSRIHFHKKRIFSDVTVNQKALKKARQSYHKEYRTERQKRIKRVKAIKRLGAKKPERSMTKMVQRIKVTAYLYRKEVFAKTKEKNVARQLTDIHKAKRHKTKLLKGQRKSVNKMFAPKYKKAKAIRKQAYKQQRKLSAGKQLVLKSKIKYRKKLNSTERALYKNQRKFQKLAQKQMKHNKVMPVAFVPVIVPSAFVLKRIGRKGWEKVLTADQNNDFVQAADKISRGASAVHSAAKPIKQKLYEKRTQTRQSKLQKERNRLTEKKNDLKKNKRKHIKKNQKPIQQRAAEKAKAAAKKAAQQTKKAVGNFAKFAMKLLGIIFVPIICMVFIFSVVMMMFTGATGNSSYILGTYTAQDRYLSWACEHYTKIAYDFNEKLLKLKTDDWKNGLNELGINTSSYNSKPDKVYFGKSAKYSAKPHFDYDEDKLAAFMCAYYYESPDENGIVPDWKWENESEIDAVLQDLFDTEYSFKHSYEDFSGWKQYQQYAVYGGGGATGGTYYTIESDGFTKSQMKLKSVPSEIWTFAKNGYLHYNYDTLEVLDANNGDKRTGYFIQDQRYFVTDPKGNKTNPFYAARSVDHSEVEKYIYNGNVTYRTYGSKYALCDKNGKETGYWIEDINKKPFKYYKFVWSHNNRSQVSFDGVEAYHIVSLYDTEKWCGQKDTYLVSFYRKNYWYDNCDLYYTVESKCTFDQAAEKVLSKLNNSAERIKFYRLLANGEENTPCGYGFHQTMDAPLGSRSLQKLIDGRKIYNRYGYNIKEWNQKDCEELNDCHEGLDILCKKGDKVYAMMSGKIEWVDESKNSLSILGDWKYWYDNNSTRKTALKYFNIKTNLKQGDTVKAGQYIGTITEKKYCYDNRDIKASKTYLHVEVAIEYGEEVFWGNWANVNPIYLMFRNDDEVIK